MFIIMTMKINPYIHAYGALGLGETGSNLEGIDDWTEIQGFEDKQIVKIRVGEHHSLFLDSAGSVWVCGQME